MRCVAVISSSHGSGVTSVGRHLVQKRLKGANGESPSVLTIPLEWNQDWSLEQSQALVQELAKSPSLPLLLMTRNSATGRVLPGMKGSYLPRAIDLWIVVVEPSLGGVRTAEKDIKRLLDIGADKADIVCAVNIKNDKDLVNAKTLGFASLDAHKVWIPFLPVIQANEAGFDSQRVKADLIEADAELDKVWDEINGYRQRASEVA